MATVWRPPTSQPVPLPRTPLIGHVLVAAAIVDLLLRPSVPLVTLAGQAGIVDGDEASLGQRLQAFPREKTVLLLLDNREHTIAAASSSASRTGLAEVASALLISPKTVHTHVPGILARIGGDSRAAAAAVAPRNGLA